MGKGGRERDTVVGRHAMFWLDKYMREARPRLLGGRLDEGAAPLWLSSKGGRLSKRDIAGMVRKHRMGAGIGRQVTTHSLRRAFATHLLANGANLEHIRRMLGHSDMRSLRQYLGATMSELKKTHGRSKVGR
jgi:integrase/recombinase XerD